MNVYTERPKQRRARQVWDYVTKKRGREPDELWKNPNCWGALSLTGFLWGWWVADFGIHQFRRWENIFPRDVPISLSPQQEKEEVR